MIAAGSDLPGGGAGDARALARTWNGSGWVAPSRGVASRVDEAQTNCLFIHGLAEGGYVFEPVVPLLGHHGPCVVVDLPGHGDAAWNEAGRYLVAQDAAEIEALCERLGLGRLVLVGHSRGGAVALHLAARGRLDIRGVALIDFAPEVNADGVRRILEGGRDEDRDYASPADYRAHLAIARPLADPATLDHYATRALRRRADGRHVLKRDGRMLAAQTTETALPGRDPAVLAMWSALGSLDCPLLIVRGEISRVVTSAVTQRMARGAADATIRTVAGAGHAVMADNPDGFVDALRPFLAVCA